MKPDADILGIFPVVISEMMPFNVPTRNWNWVGGVKTPPYEWRVG